MDKIVMIMLRLRQVRHEEKEQKESQHRIRIAWFVVEFCLLDYYYRALFRLREEDLSLER